jgi:prepilin-type N-terminal cleavage/methylation domain-containing protein
VTCIDFHSSNRSRQAGFNTIELMVVIVLLGILAVNVMPQTTAMFGVRDATWHDSVLSALRTAQKSAVARRRLTCVTVNATTVVVTTSSVNPAAAGTPCDKPINGPDGSATFATSDNSNSTTTVSPSGVIYFQPDGRATSDYAGAFSSSRTITVSGASNIVLYGETGYVQ